MALLDEGETDWKVIVVDVQDPLASKLNDIEDVERHLPGLIRATNEWFRFDISPLSGADMPSTVSPLGFIRFPMASRKTPLPFLEKLKTKNMQPRSFTSVTKLGVVLSLGKLPRKPRHTISPCLSHTFHLLI